MAAVERLMGLGMAPELARRVGFFVQTVEGGTLQGPGNFYVKASSTATLVLSANFDIGDIVVVGAAATTPVSPDAASVIWPTSAGVAHNVSSGVARAFMRFSKTEWFVISSV